jgi:hypothetical protein
MKTIEAVVVVAPDGTFSVTAPPDVAPGAHRVVVVIDDAPASAAPPPPLELPLLPAVPWPENFSLRREDLYDDWGR